MQHRPVDSKRRTALALVVLSLAALGCGDDQPSLSRAELLDSETCRECHPRHVEEWESSMHAYASDDPVFLAMNERGQQEADLGEFCVQCHAPMAVADGATTDGLNLDEVPRELKGVTCFFCHTVEDIDDDHNNGLVLADDTVMRGGFANATKNPAHATTYSPLHDRLDQESTDMCGSCHDIVTPAGVHLERTFLEWQESFFNRPHTQGGLSCGNCHMVGDEDEVVADFEGVSSRTYHEHTFPGIDVALTEWPGKDLQLAGIERDLKGVIIPILCVNPAEGGKIEYDLENFGAGHMLPSGASADRRMWAEIRATLGGTPVLESGIVADGQAVAEAAASDPKFWQLRDFATDDNGDDAHFFWEVRNVDSELLKPLVTLDRNDPLFPHSTRRDFTLDGQPLPDRVEARVLIRPIGLEIIDELIASGHLDASFRDKFPTFAIEGTEIVWTQADAESDGCVARGRPASSAR